MPRINNKAMPKPEIKAVIFDLGGVVIDWSDDIVYRKAAKISGLPFEKLRKVAEREKQSFMQGEFSESEFWRRVLKKSGRHDHILRKLDRLWYKEYKKNAKLNRDVINIIRKLSGRYSLGVISNLNVVHDAVNRKRKYYRYLKHRVLSYKAGVTKPDIRIYRLAAKKVRCKPRQCLFIDDKPENVKGARKAGMNAIRYKDVAQLKKDLRRYNIKI